MTVMSESRDGAAISSTGILWLTFQLDEKFFSIVSNVIMDALNLFFIFQLFPLVNS